MHLGIIYQTQKNGPNSNSGLLLLQEAASLGDPISHFVLGLLNRDADSVPKDLIRSLYHLSMSVQLGYAAIRREFGLLQDLIKEDLNISIRIEQGPVPSKSKVPRSNTPSKSSPLFEEYLKKTDVRTVDSKYWQQDIQTETPDSTPRSKLIEFERFQRGLGVLRDESRARKLLIESALGRDIVALSICVIDGIDFPKNVTFAIELLLSQTNDDIAAFYLGQVRLNGILIDANANEGVRLIRASALSGNPAAAFALAEILERGLHGTPKDLAESLNWYSKAGSFGDAEALVRLGNYFRDGIAVQADFAAALDLYDQATKLGHSDAPKRAAKLRSAIDSLVNGRKELIQCKRERDNANRELRTLKTERDNAVKDRDEALRLRDEALLSAE